MRWRRDIKLTYALALAATAVNAACEENIVRVRLYNYAGVTQATLSKATAEASRVLRHAGVRVDWLTCRLKQTNPLLDPGCVVPVTALDLQVRILDPAMAKRVRKSGDDLGYALLAEGFDSFASIFFKGILDLERGNLAPRCVVLGAVLAHEIAHLLLEQRTHSPVGILRASWTDADLKSIARGQMGFTVEQGSAMTANISKRKEASGIGRLAPPIMVPGN